MTDNSNLNCSKCGNPLTPGITSCPVCGTPVVENNNVDAQPAIQEVAPVAPEVAMPDVSVQPTEVASSEPVAPVMPEAPVVSPEPAPVVAPIAPTPVDAQTAPDLAPSIMPTESANVIPNVSASAASPVSTIVEKPVQEQVVKKGLKLKINNKTLLILLGVIVLFVVAAMFLKGGGGNAPTAGGNPQAQQPTVATVDAVANGFIFKVEDGWLVQSSSENTIIKNAAGTVVVKLESYKKSLTDISKDKLQSNFNNLGNTYNPNPVIAKDVDISEIKINSKDAYLVNCKITETDNKDYLAQYYLINGGSELIIGATVVYYNEEAKTSYEGVISTLMGTLSYADNSNSIRETISATGKTFSVYYNAINGVNVEIPIPEEPEQSEIVE